MNYAEFYKQSADDPQTFRAKQAELTDWHQPYTQVLDYSNPTRCWILGASWVRCNLGSDGGLS